MSYSLKDISIIIPTYNRARDLEKTLNSFRWAWNQLKEILIIDQSTTNETKNLIKKLRSHRIQYFHSSTPSLTAARNKGISHVHPQTAIVLFLDDDVTLSKGYFSRILEVFNHYPNALGVGGYYLPREVRMGHIETFLRKLFFIEHKAPESVRVLSSYGAIYPSTLTAPIEAQWIPGFNMAFKQEVLKDQHFDENLSRYSLAEDFDFTYRLASKRPGSLYLTPHARLVHRASPVERYPARKISFMNQIHHFYLHYKNFNKTLKEKLTFFWAVVGISLLRTTYFIAHPTKREGLRLRFYFASLIYCLTHATSIRKGIWHIPG